MTIHDRIAKIRKRAYAKSHLSEACEDSWVDIEWLLERLVLADKLADVADMCRTYLCAQEPLCELTDAIAAYRGDDDV